ncbi:MAG: hypothetical protein JNK82_14530 [Myxococcaceae bacterium]|nr:hypothetical protein [Myxococcaceae bacterium]
MRALYTHPEFTWADGPGTVAAGTRLYGVLDEEACGSAACGGIVAVDAATGARSLSRAGQLAGPTMSVEQRIAPVLTFGTALVNSVSFAADMPIADLGPYEGNATSLPLAGVATLSDGRIVYFRAAELRPIVTSVGPVQTSVTIPDGGVFEPRPDAGVVGPELSLRNGSFRFDETVTVAADPAGDYVVSGTVSGYMGRTGPGQTFTFPGSYYFHASDYNPANPALTMKLPVEPLRPSETYVLTIASNYLPLELTLSQTVCAAGFTQYPGTVVLDAERGVTFIGYPSANAIVEVPYTAVARVQLLASGVLCWR